MKSLLVCGSILSGCLSFMACANQQPEGLSTIGDAFRASFFEYEQNSQKAVEYYDALRRHPVIPHGVIHSYVRFLQKKNQHREILSMLDLLDKQLAKDAEVQLAIVEALDATHQYQLAAERIVRLNQQFPDHQKIAVYTVQLYLNQRNTYKALDVIDNFLNVAMHQPSNFIFYFFKAQIYLSQNRKKEAAVAFKECLSLNQHAEKIWLIYSLLEEELNNIDGAIEACSRAADITDNPVIRQRLLVLLTKKQGAGEKTISPANTCYHKAKTLLEQEKFTEALRQIDECLKQQKSDEGRLLKVQILGAMGSVDKALAELAQLMIDEPENEIWFKAASLLRKQGLSKRSLENSLLACEQKHPQALMPMMYLADTYLRSGNEQKALTYLKKMTTMKLPMPLKTKVYYQLARLYYEQKDTPAMVQALENGYSCDASFAPICNMLAYYYAGKGHNLGKADEFLKKALAKEPRNPHYLETASYIAYKQGDYQKAAAIIEPLATAVPRDTVIERHIQKIELALARRGKQQNIIK